MTAKQPQTSTFRPGKVKVLDMKEQEKEVDGWLLGDTGLGYHLVHHDNPNVPDGFFPTHLNSGCMLGGFMLGLPVRKCRAFLLEIKDMAPWSEVTTREEINARLVQPGILKEVNRIARKYE
ncbi:MAG: hypothetical protein J0I20_33790 [Chloroflexi bacterium]|nr:hypothetical protein [Chloroflexota bacterium]OJW05566.1 MAG: hypothetical protein BGO39_02815 [Chloroflexi bacterium 54-19]